MALRGFGLVHVDDFYFKLITKEKKNPHKICAGIEMKSVRTNIYIKFKETTNI